MFLPGFAMLCGSYDKHQRGTTLEDVAHAGFGGFGLCMNQFADSHNSEIALSRGSITPGATTRDCMHSLTSAPPSMKVHTAAG